MKIKITHCRYCGGTEFITAFQNFYGSVTSAESMLKTETLYHTICKSCGSVVRSYVKDPEKLLKKKDRTSQ